MRTVLLSFADRHPLRPAWVALALALGGAALPARAQVPVITGRAPTAQAVAAPRAANVALTFSEPMSAGTASGAALRVFSSQRGGLLTHPGGGTFSGGGTGTVTFDPDTDFRPGETVSVTATTAARSVGGQALAAGQVHQFIVAAAPAAATFAPGVDLTMGSQASLAIAGDVDGDGDLDLLTSDNAATGTVSIRRNDGTGTFGARVTISVTGFPSELALADVDGDGDLDLLTVAQLAGTVSVRVNDGTGTFSGTTEVPVGLFPRSLALADLDADGDLDLLTANQGDATVSIRRNDGAGAFSGTTDVAVAAGPYYVTAADVDSDGDFDLLTANGLNTVSIRRNDGTGAFSAPPGAGAAEVAVGPGCYHLAVADVDADGAPDLLAACQASRTVDVCRNDGTGTFGLPTSVVFSHKPQHVALADVDGDGDLDLLVANYTTLGFVSVRLNAGGVFGGGTDVPVNNSPVSVRAADFDGNGTLDLFTASSVAGSVALRFNAAAVPFALVSTTPGANAANVPRGVRPSALFNQPLAFAPTAAVRFTSAQVASRYTWFLPGFGGPDTYDMVPDAPFLPGDLITLSVSRTARSATTGQTLARSHVRQFRVAAGAGPGAFEHTTDLAGVAHQADVTLADLDADGFLDLLTVSFSAATVTLRRGTGAGTFAATTSAFAVGPGPLALATADVDGDGLLDLLTANADNNTVSVLRNDGAGGFVALPPVAAGAEARALAVADLDGDGDQDLLVANGMAGTVSVRVNDGTGTFSGTTDVPVGPGPQDLAVGDVDGDDDLDLLTANSNGTVSVRRNDGTGTFGAPTEIPIGAYPNRLALGDVDGDGDLDVLTANLVANSVSIRLNDGAGTYSGTGSFGSTGPLIVRLADVDGDGDLDALVAGTPDQFSVHLNTGGTFGPGNGPLAGYGLRTFAVGDVDGDLDLDVVTISESAPTASILLNQVGPPFALVSTTPAANATHAAPAGTQTFTFNQTYNFSSVAAITVFNSQTGGSLVSTLSSSGGPTITANPGGAYHPGEEISSTVTTAARSATTGQTLSRGYVQQWRVAAGPGPGTFVAAAPAVSATPLVTAVADVNEDGHLDLLTAGSAAGSGLSQISVQLGTGLGGFGAATLVPVDPLATRVVLADVNHDAHLDLLVPSQSTNRVNVRPGNGRGGFAGSTNVPVNGSADDLAVADVDADGHLDLLVPNASAGTVSVRRGDGAGGFAGPANVAVGSAPTRVFAVDVDLDGDLDLLTCSPGAGLTRCLNDGLGHFGPATGLPGGPAPTDVVVGDVTGDGLPDLLTLLVAPPTATVSVRVGTGSGAFAAAALVSTVPGFTDFATLALADVQGDGWLDLVLADHAGQRVVLLPGTGVGSGSSLFGPATTTPVAGQPRRPVAADVNDDGALDLLLPMPAAGAVAVLLNQAVLPDLVVNTFTTIPGGHYRTITVTGTGDGTLTADVTVTDAVVVQAGGRWTDGCFVLTGPGSFTLAAGALLNICSPQGISLVGPTGSIQVTGMRTYSPHAQYVYNGGSPQITGLGLPGRVLALYYRGVGGLTLSQPLGVRLGVALIGDAPLLLNGRMLTLLSDRDTTAMLVNLGAGRVVGAATVQRWIAPGTNPGRGYRHLSSPVAGAPVADLAGPGFAPLVNAAYNTLPRPALPASRFPNVFGFDERRAPASGAFGDGYFSPATLAEPLAVGRGYAVAISAGLTPDLVGSLTQDEVTLGGLTRTGGSLPGNQKAGWHLLGNPYPSPLDWDAVPVPPGMQASISVLRSTGLNTGVYLTRAGGVGSLPDGLLPMGQAFFARVLGAGPVALTLPNTARPIGYVNPTYARPTPPTLRPLLTLTLGAAGAGAPADEAFVYLDPAATPGLDEAFDGTRPARNPGQPTLATLIGADEAAVNALPTALPASGLTVELVAALPVPGPYRLAVGTLANFGDTPVALLDRLTHTRYDLATHPVVPLTTTRPDEEISGRFALLFGAAATVTGAADFNPTPATLLLWPNPTTGAVQVRVPAGATRVEVLDLTGRVVYTEPVTNTATTLLLAALPKGVYVVRAGGQRARLVVD